MAKKKASSYTAGGRLKVSAGGSSRAMMAASKRIRDTPLKGMTRAGITKRLKSDKGYSSMGTLSGRDIARAYSNKVLSGGSSE